MIEIKNSFAPSSIRIRKFRPSDLSRVYEIECRSFKDPYHILFLLNLYELYPSTFLVAEVDGIVAGYIISRIVNNSGHILAVAVAPEYRKRGLGRALTEVTLKEFEEFGLESAWLEVRLSNSAAIYLYKSLGFEEKGIVNLYYADSESAVILKKEF